MDSYYTVRASKDGYRDKTVVIDTHLPANELKYKSTSFAINLDASEKFAHSDQFYLDFPSAIIQWDGEKKHPIEDGPAGCPSGDPIAHNPLFEGVRRSSHAFFVSAGRSPPPRAGSADGSGR